MNIIIANIKLSNGIECFHQINEYIGNTIEVANSESKHMNSNVKTCKELNVMNERHNNELPSHVACENKTERS